ncbi:hypothetical protein SAMN05216338_11081 [Bradyrhizobium sp. Rc2d]|uniref:hypothetical protein n=1 Tax=Bradyrhizobium sp. Rc2d TaxID=1855321 RepID=UPI0008902B94|nr:hypothetical protein [Bradyrhizobium sp. Rc2d]SDK18986.1 hypothetical protein SAMN05216338_11081 [Bradyrhizobium sp. Rc2d]
MRALSVSLVIATIVCTASLTAAAKDSKARKEGTGTTFSAPVKVYIEDDDEAKAQNPPANQSMMTAPSSAPDAPQVSNSEAHEAAETLDLSLQCASKPIRYQDQHLNHTVTKSLGDEKRLQFTAEVKEGDKAPYTLAVSVAYKDLNNVELDRPLDQTFLDGRPVVNVKVYCKKSAPNCVDVGFVMGSRTSVTFVPACNIETAQRARLAIDTLIKFNN